MKKRLAKILVLFITVFLWVGCSNTDGVINDSENTETDKQIIPESIPMPESGILPKPELDIIERMTVPSGEKAKIALKPVPDGCSIYYSIEESDSDDEWIIYKDPIEIKESKDFILHALTRKSGYEDSSITTKEFRYIQGCLPPPPDYGSFYLEPIKIGDKVIRGEFKDQHLWPSKYNQMTISLKINETIRISITEQEIDNGIFEFKLEKRLLQGDIVQVTAESDENIVWFNMITPELFEYTYYRVHYYTEPIIIK